MNYVKRFAHYVVALIVVLFFFIGASGIDKNAHEMELLRSKGGTSVAEVYYQSHGGVLSGEATVNRGLGVSFAALIIYLGELLNKGSKKENDTEDANQDKPVPEEPNV